jgi:hypothetical protein
MLRINVLVVGSLSLHFNDVVRFGKIEQSGFGKDAVDVHCGFSSSSKKEKKCYEKKNRCKFLT